MFSGSVASVFVLRDRTNSARATSSQSEVSGVLARSARGCEEAMLNGLAVLRSWRDSMAPIIISAALLIGMSSSSFAATDESFIENSDIWPKIKASLFGERPVKEAPEGVLELRAPARAADAATVPISMKVGHGANAPAAKALYLVVDKNPSPIAAVFRFSEESGHAYVETRIRIEEYTPVRAVVELENGELYSTAKFVKASGGCSAPAQKTDSGNRIGKMRLTMEEGFSSDRAQLVRFSMIHPNHSGLAMDQSTRHYTPAWYVRTIRISYAGRTIMEADVDFSLSENPNVRFYFKPQGEGKLSAEAIDTKDLKYETGADPSAASSTAESQN